MSTKADYVRSQGQTRDHHCHWPGCDHCYAEGMNKWLRGGKNWGPGAPRRWYSTDHWLKPRR